MFRWLVTLVLAAEVVALVLLLAVAAEPAGLPVPLLAAAIPLTLILVVLVAYHSRSGITREIRWLSPEDITDYEPAVETVAATPESLSRSIVERAGEIRRTLLSSPSEVQIEMCALGYRACVNDMITLTHLINEELPEANLLRRLTLRRGRKKATDALASAREVLPSGALRATRQEQQ